MPLNLLPLPPLQEARLAVYLSWLPPLKLQLTTLCTANKVPLGVAIAWIQCESGGHINEVTKLDERGYFQLMPEESHDLHIDHQKLSIDEAYSLGAGFTLINYYRIASRNVCKALGCTPFVAGSEDEWRLIKFCHSIGLGATKTMLKDAVGDVNPQSWRSFAIYMQSNSDYYLAKLGHSPNKWINFIDMMFQIGRPFGLSLLVA